jgi:hypothetical protein
VEAIHTPRNQKWLDILPNILSTYNNRKHSTIKMPPAKVNKKNEKQLLKNVYKIQQRKVQPSKLKVGNYVRISKQKTVFKKGYTQNWSNEIFKIIKVQNTIPKTYLLEDFNGEAILGGFYKEELQETSLNDVYYVEKIIKKSGDKIYVKWLGYDSSHNSWVNKNDVYV